MLNDEMIAMGVKINACWRRYPHYSIEYIVPSAEESVLQFCSIVSRWYPGVEELCSPGESVKEVRCKTNRLWSRDSTTTIIKVECHCNEPSGDSTTA